MRKTLLLMASVIFALVMLSSCKSEPKTLTSGQWSIDFLGDVNTYQFNDDMTESIFHLQEKITATISHTRLLATQYSSNRFRTRSST